MPGGRLVGFWETCVSRHRGNRGARRLIGVGAPRFARVERTDVRAPVGVRELPLLPAGILRIAKPVPSVAHAGAARRGAGSSPRRPGATAARGGWAARAHPALLASDEPRCARP